MSQYDVIFDKCPYSTYSLTTSDFRTLLNLRPRYHTLPFFFKCKVPGRAGVTALAEAKKTLSRVWEAKAALEAATGKRL
jgi:hypothetical protein